MTCVKGDASRSVLSPILHLMVDVDKSARDGVLSVFAVH